MHNEVISKIRYKLTKPLPGWTSQVKMAPSFRPDHTPRENCTKAGVLLLLYPNLTDLSLILIKRPQYKGIHSGQISLPGGKVETSDKNLIDTALRETEEEIGVPAKFIDVLGTLTPLYIPVSDTEVFPSVGFTGEKPLFEPDPYEVDFLIELPIAQLLKPEIIETKIYQDNKYNGIIPYFNINNNHIWGATAMILSEFIDIIYNLD